MSGTTDKKFLGLDGLEKLVDNIKASFSSVNHVHDNYTLKSDFQSLETSLSDGNLTVAEATHAVSADSAAHAATATTSEAAVKAVQDANGNAITETYETKSDASAKLTEAKSYADTQIAALVNAAPETLDTLGELATAFQENKEVVDALDAAITNKADIDHVHSWNDLEDRPFGENVEIIATCAYDADSEHNTVAGWDEYECQMYYVSSEFVPLDNYTDFTILVDGVAVGSGCFDAIDTEQKMTYLSPWTATVDGTTYSGWVCRCPSQEYEFVDYNGGTRGSGVAGIYMSGVENMPEFDIAIASTKTLDPKYLPDTVADKTYVDEAVANIDIPEQVNADWSVNDPSSPAYIANRTHWIGDGVETFIIEEVAVEITEANGSVTIPYSITFDIGTTYTVTFNGTQYECVAYDMWDAPIIGNGTIAGGDESGNGEPFAIVGNYNLVYTAEVGAHIISISQKTPEIHKIDPIFLPEQEQSIGKAGEGLGAEIFNYYGDDGGVSTFALAPDDSPTSNVATGEYSHAEGYLTSATGDYSHTEGGNTKASGFCSHAEGIFTTATEEAAHAEGSNTTAYGQHSHAEGSSTEASGLSSHAEGTMTIAAGESSHAEGYYTEANGDYQHVQGKHNVADGSSVYAHIVGNGANRDEPSNAHTLDWSGNAWYQGGIYVGGTVLTNEDGTVDYSGASEVMLKSDIVAITNEEIDAIFESI